jgi:hypothetical protein
MADYANGIWKGPSRQPDCLQSSGLLQIGQTPGTGTPVVFAVPRGAHQAEGATHTEQRLPGDCLEHLEEKGLDVIQNNVSIPRAVLT